MAGSTAQLRRFALGQRVEVLFGGGNAYYGGQIAAVHADGTYDIDYDDGEAEQRVVPAWVEDAAEGELAARGGGLGMWGFGEAESDEEEDEEKGRGDAEGGAPAVSEEQTAAVTAAKAAAAAAALAAIEDAALAAALAAPPAFDPSDLRESAQTVATLSDPRYWEAVCPWLHCGRDSAREGNARAASVPAAAPVSRSSSGGGGGGGGSSSSSSSSSISGDSAGGDSDSAGGDSDSAGGVDARAAAAEMRDRGFFQLGAEVVAAQMAGKPHQAGRHPSELVRGLERGVLRLVELGHSASAIAAFDEAWQLAEAISPLLERVTGNAPLGDWFSFHVTAARPSGFVGPHRDKPLAGPETFRASDGMPMYNTVWVALSDASPEMSCLYFVPKADDAEYAVVGDRLGGVLPTFLSWQNIVAQPVRAGALLCFSHRVVHWGSKASPLCVRPRVAMSFALADPAFERPSFDAARFLPYPPLPLRVGMRAAQAILYNTQVPLGAAQLALNNRIFCGAKRFFTPHYAERIVAEAQYLKFKAKHSGLAEKIGHAR
jgi:hypothetical protein